jgi:predicted GIY-YIG superfamily endonuclease
MTRTALYRAFSADGDLLYIGISRNFGRRWYQHASVKPWWPEAQRMTVDWYPDEESAYAAETEAIAREKPRYNIAKVPRLRWTVHVPERDMSRASRTRATGRMLRQRKRPTRVRARRRPGAGAARSGFTMMAAFAELERDQIHMRTMADLAAARTQGRVGGRPTVMDEDKLAAARARRERGESPTEIARALGVSRASVYRHLNPPEAS